MDCSTADPARLTNLFRAPKHPLKAPAAGAGFATRQRQNRGMNRNPKAPSISRRAWAKRKAAQVGRQLQEAVAIQAGSDWRERSRKASLISRLVAEEARYRRLAGPPADLGEDLPF